MALGTGSEINDCRLQTVRKVTYYSLAFSHGPRCSGEVWVGEMRVLAHAIDAEVGVVSCVFFVCDYIFFSCPILELVVNEVLPSILGLELVYLDENRRAFF